MCRMMLYHSGKPSFLQGEFMNKKIGNESGEVEPADPKGEVRELAQV